MFRSGSNAYVSDSERIAIVHGGQERMVLRRHLAEIIQARTDEFLDLIRKNSSHAPVMTLHRQELS